MNVSHVKCVHVQMSIQKLDIDTFGWRFVALFCPLFCYRLVLSVYEMLCERQGMNSAGLC